MFVIFYGDVEVIWDFVLFKEFNKEMGIFGEKLVCKMVIK